MRSKEAYTVSIGVLALVDAYLTATVLPLPVWVTFIAWASFFILGGRGRGLVQSIASNLSGLVIGALTLLAITSTSGSPLAAAILVGIGSAAMVQASKLTLLHALPAVVWGFASTVGTTMATGRPITTAGLDNPALVAAAALVVGALFGYVSEVLGELLTEKSVKLA